MVDCGLFQGLKELRLKNWSPLPIAPKDVKSVILTHAHIDHSGYVPLFIRNGFKGKVLASEGTIELCKILLPDSGYLQEEDAKYATKKGFSKHKPALPLYTYQDAIDALPCFKSIPDEEEVPLSDTATVQLYRAGHILGSRFVKISLKNGTYKSILFAGDIGRYDSLITRDPTTIEKGVDYLVLESTYGNHKHPEEDIFKRFEDIIHATVKKDGKVLIPAFAVGRTQEILFILKQLSKQKRLPPNIPIYLNTPLGIDATAIYTRFVKEHRILNGGVDPNMFHMPNLHFVHDQADSKELNRLEGPAIIVSASGMMTGGRILHHLKAYAGNPNNTLIIVGFQAAGTRGRSILDGSKAIKIHGLPVGINCTVEYIESLSAHGDFEDILKWLSLFKRAPKTIFLVHGEPEALDAMKKNIEKEMKHTNIIVPKYLEKIELV
jgi:metallo-beta-lactamase family protein